MFIIESYSIAVIFCIITMLCWGSWANTQKLSEGKWQFELFYWDYVIGILLTALIIALTLGSIGEQGRAFVPDVQQAEAENITSALLGGVIFNAANILLGAAIAVAGMAVAFPVGIGLALVIGVIVNYLDNPVGDSTLLFSGVALVALAIVLNAFAYHRSMVSSKKLPVKGLLLSVISGIAMGYFYNYVAASMFPDFNTPLPGKLSPYSAVFFFSIGIFISNFIFNSILMKKPFTGEPVSYSDYFRGSKRNHIIGMLGGLIWCIGMSFSIIASGKAGTAISYGLGQGATVVAALWGIYVWKEFDKAPGNTKIILNTMLICYLTGLGLIIAAR